MSKKEILRDIDGYNGLYQISNLGRVKSFNQKKERILKPYLCNDGYLRVVLSINGKTKAFYIHRLIAIHFIMNPENKKTVNHRNCIKTDNRINNLEWATQKENINHAWDSGVCTPHANYGARSLKDSEVIEIKKRLKNFKKGMVKELQTEYKVCYNVIYKIKNNETYTNIKI